MIKVNSFEFKKIFVQQFNPNENTTTYLYSFCRKFSFWNSYRHSVLSFLKQSWLGKFFFSSLQSNNKMLSCWKTMKTNCIFFNYSRHWWFLTAGAEVSECWLMKLICRINLIVFDCSWPRPPPAITAVLLFFFSFVCHKLSGLSQCLFASQDKQWKQSLYLPSGVVALNAS